MLFEIVGAKSDSGDDVDVFLEAKDQSEVEQLAHERGILVSAIKAAAATQEKDETISLIEDEPAADGHPGEHKAGLITINASSPAGTAHTGAGTIHREDKTEAAMEYHIMLNQSLYLLESAVNKYIKDGWEPQGGVSVGVSNNAMQYFQAMIRRKKTA